MYQTLALLAIFVLIYSSIGGGVERSPISGPIVFIVFGLLIGPSRFWESAFSWLWITKQSGS